MLNETSIKGINEGSYISCVFEFTKKILYSVSYSEETRFDTLLRVNESHCRVQEVLG